MILKKKKNNANIFKAWFMVHLYKKKHGGGVRLQISNYVLQYQHLSAFLCQG